MNQQQTLVGLVIGLIIGAGVGYMVSPSETSDTTNLENEINTLQNQVTQLESQKAVLETQLSNAQDDLTESTNTLEELLSDYNSLKSEYDSFKNEIETVDVSAYEDTIDDLEAQIIALNQEIEALQAITPSIVLGDWNEIASFSGIGNQVTDYFFVPELDDVELRITWKNYSSDSDKWIHSIDIYERGADRNYEYLLLPELKEGSVTIHAPIPTGDQYIDVDTWIYSDPQWDLTIEAWIPE